jgi:hypothetical protein
VTPEDDFMSDRVLDYLEASAIAEAKKVRAQELYQELLGFLDDVADAVLDGPQLNNEEVNLLAQLPREDLEQIVDFAEQSADDLLEYANLAQQAIEAQGEAAADAK